MLSLVVPCFNEEESLLAFYHSLKDIMEKIAYKYEVIFVDDGSTDHTLDVIKDIALKDIHIFWLSFSRNFGKEAAIYAGLKSTHGKYIAVMDADMQDPPSLLPQMIEILEEGGYDCVATCRSNRTGEPRVRSWFARKFYKIINYISDADIVDGARDFRLMKRKMVDAITSMTEYNRFSKGIFGWVGFRTYWLSYDNIERVAGTTKWNFVKLFKYGIDGIINFSQVPLNIASWFGISMTFFSFLGLLFLVARKLFWGDPVAGWASTICIIIFIGGVQLLCLGIIGQYIAKIYMETKNRPHYIIAQSNIIDKDEQKK